MKLTEVTKLTTGVPGLDRLTHGGIPEGRATLVTGKSGTGKSIIALQMAAHLAREGKQPLVLAVEEPPEDLAVTGNTLGFDLTGLMESGRLRISDATRPMAGPVVVAGEYDLGGLLHRIAATVRETKARVVILDSVTALFSPRPPQELLRSLFFQLVHALRELDVTAILLAEAEEAHGPLTTLGVEDYVCDMVLILRNTVDGERRRRSIEINKYRRSAHYKGEYPCTITSKGLAIFPMAIGKALPSTQDRYSSGAPGLDTMLSGGLFRDSIVIVRGPTGSGKTILAGLYAHAGASRGERVVYHGFEEPQPMLMRNFERIGLPMGELYEKGLLRVICRYPESTGLEDLLVMLRDGIEEFQPALVVLDSISSIEHASSQKGFRQFMIGVASMLRETGRGALLTQNVRVGTDREAEPPFLSTISDAIVNLDYELEKGPLRRTLRVVKMRGSDHDVRPARLVIARGGVRVEPDAAVGSPAEEHLASALAGLTVLVVEDFHDAREALTALLTRAGARTLSAGSASEARRVLSSGEPPDVIVCDVGLTDEDGYSLLAGLRRSGGPASRIPAVALTAWGRPEDRERSTAAGFDAHLVKPVEPAVLVSTLLGVTRTSRPPGLSGRVVGA
jgi:circadian clock protein KaiC